MTRKQNGEQTYEAGQRFSTYGGRGSGLVITLRKEASFIQTLKLIELVWALGSTRQTINQQDFLRKENEIATILQSPNMADINACLDGRPLVHSIVKNGSPGLLRRIMHSSSMLDVAATDKDGNNAINFLLYSPFYKIKNPITHQQDVRDKCSLLFGIASMDVTRIHPVERYGDIGYNHELVNGSIGDTSAHLTNLFLTRQLLIKSITLSNMARLLKARTNECLRDNDRASTLEHICNKQSQLENEISAELSLMLKSSGFARDVFKETLRSNPLAAPTLAREFTFGLKGENPQLKMASDLLPAPVREGSKIFDRIHREMSLPLPKLIGFL